MRLFWIFFVTLLTMTVPVPAAAHDLWIEQTADGWVLYRGHRYSRHAGEELMVYHPDIVQLIRCADSSGTITEIDSPPEYPVTIDTPCPVLMITLHPSAWTKTPYGTKNLPKNEAPSPLKSWMSMENVKRINSWSKRFSEPLTEELELVPVQDPLNLKPGDKLRLNVTYRGKPVENVAVSYNGSPRGVTDKKGRINIKLRHVGLQLIQATLTLPIDSEQADIAIHTTCLNFETEGGG
jgi:nickel transport protein